MNSPLDADQPPGAIGNTVVERGLLIQAGAKQLVGVLSSSARPTPLPALLVVVGGPQYRVGSHRLFVQLARFLAQAGHCVLRFDVGGMGDSLGDTQDFTRLGIDIGYAVDALALETAAGTPVVLWGLCDGGSAALMYLQSSRDPRVAGVVLLNPWVRSESSLAQARVKHYYWERLRQRDFWVSLLKGRVAGSALTQLLRNLRLAFKPGARSEPRGQSLSFQERMRLGWDRFAGPVLLLLSENDLTAQEFREFTKSDKRWHHLLARDATRCVTVPGADHTFSDREAKQAVLSITARWMCERVSPPRIS